MQKYQRHFKHGETPQKERIPGREDQVENQAGGFVFKVDMWKRLERFLVLGSDKPTYYASAEKLTRNSFTNLEQCIKADGVRTVGIIERISDEGRAPSNDPALAALAGCMVVGDDATKKAARKSMLKVARIGTHLFNLLSYYQAIWSGKWGRGMRNAVSAWYTTKDTGRLAYQLAKYRQRDGWTHRDVLRLAHPTSTGDSKVAIAWGAGNVVFDEDFGPRWMKLVGKGRESKKVPGDPIVWPQDLRIIEGFEMAQKASNWQESKRLINEYRLTHEMIKSEHLGQPQIWEALLPSMPFTALIRNLGRMSANGLLVQGDESVRAAVQKLSDEEGLRKARVHPITVLNALFTYKQGHGGRGKLSWTPVSKIVDALDDAFYASFKHIEPTGKRMLLAIDVSGSMTWNHIPRLPALTPRDGAACMAMATAKVEKDYEIVAFSHTMVPVDVSPRMRLDTVISTIQAAGAGGTDCSLPMRWAMGDGRSAHAWNRRNAYNQEQHIPKSVQKYDLFSIYTDSETWFGDIHPCQALRKYRDASGVNAKLVVVAMEQNDFSIADPKDAGTLDIVGFDSNAPAIISEFARG